MGVTVWPSEVAVAMRLDGTDVALRGPDPIDAEAIAAAVNASRVHLRGFLAWAEEPATVDQQAVRLAVAAEAFAAGGDAPYTIFSGDEVVGGIGLHRRPGPGALEIGYWVHVDHEGRGIITAAVRALLPVAFDVDGAERVVIRCDAANARSAAVPRRLGFALMDELDDDRAAPLHTGRTQLWELPRPSKARFGS